MASNVFSHDKNSQKEEGNKVTPVYVKCLNVLYLCGFKTKKGYTSTKLIRSSEQLRSTNKS